MGRPRGFEEAVAVDAAATVFRRRGYASTSVDHLVEATGVHRGSLYGTFGSKQGLFMRVLDAVDAASDSEGRLDVVLVGLLELAPEDRRVRERIAGLLEVHGITEEELGSRLLTRAGLHQEKETS
ncbi:TetR/AcrR family transcriptional regulator [Auraticoccus monumenti]|uniref:Regulatory protein, tetR family n=1 Tax=Auraticoccus monumenti TaxID=675864 RepID=A0A1G7BRY8_9ACTN|nr:helix-turn-helix domain-containing protein [Auraticoccus monumenti]SDE29410.1 regulatory protein, tetR family [Auraticoccus monumenti]